MDWTGNIIIIIIIIIITILIGAFISIFPPNQLKARRAERVEAYGSTQ